jgi:hypothetical protein
VACISPSLAVAVVVNPSVKVDDLSFVELRRIMFAERQFWTTGQPITLIGRAPVALERTVLLERAYRMSQARYREYWVAKFFRVDGTAVRTVRLDADDVAGESRRVVGPQRVVPERPRLRPGPARLRPGQRGFVRAEDQADDLARWPSAGASSSPSPGDWTVSRSLVQRSP